MNSRTLDLYIHNIKEELDLFNLRQHLTNYKLFKKIRSITGVNLHFDMTIHYSKIKKGFCYKSAPDEGVLHELEIVNINSNVICYSLEIGGDIIVVARFTQPRIKPKNLLKYRVDNGICERSCQAAELEREFEAVVGVNFSPSRQNKFISIEGKVIEELFLKVEEEDSLYKGLQLSILSKDGWVREWTLDFIGKYISYGIMITPDETPKEKQGD